MSQESKEPAPFLSGEEIAGLEAILGTHPLRLFFPGVSRLGLRSGDQLSLDTPWPKLPPRHSASAAILDHAASALPLVKLRRAVHRAAWLLAPGGCFWLVTRDPDDPRYAAAGRPWPGEEVVIDGGTEFYRPLRHYLELARLFPLRPRTPRGAGTEGTLLWKWEREEEDCDATPRPAADDSPRVVHDSAEAARLDAKYGPESPYRRFNRLEEPEILDDLLYGIARLRPAPGERVLSLGVNDGRELTLFAEAGHRDVEFWGIDASPLAIETARGRFPPPHRFFPVSFEQLATLELPTFRVALLLNVLQCTTVDRAELFRHLKRRLAPRCRILISLPNCHFGAHDILRRPLDRKDPRHDRSLLLKDARYWARQLYRDGFSSVETFGTYDVFLFGER